MMLKKLTIYVVLAVLCPFLGLGQRAGTGAVDVTLKGLQIGQKVPEVMLSGLHNYKDAGGKSVPSAKLSDFRGKLLILDFWATWCSPCVAMIPRMDSLQKVFGDRVAFLSVTYQSDQEVLPFLYRLEKQLGRKFDLPVLTGSKELNGLFPHVYLPHYVWIDGDGVVRGITGQDMVNGVQINQVLSTGGLNSLAKKSDYDIPFDLKKGLFVDGNGGSEGLVRSKSVFSKYAIGLKGGSRIFDRNRGEKNHTIVLQCINQTIKNIYKRAFGNGKRIPDSRILLDLADSSKVTTELTGNDYLNWLAENGYCYELSMPIGEQGNLFLRMQQDLSFNFPQYVASFQNLERECLVLERVGRAVDLSSTGEKSFAKFTMGGVEMADKPLLVFVQALQDYYMQNSKLPILDETGIKGNVSMKVDGDLTSLTKLNLGLSAVGLQLAIRKRVVPMLVISDRNSVKSNSK